MVFWIIMALVVVGGAIGFAVAREYHWFDWETFWTIMFTALFAVGIALMMFTMFTILLNKDNPEYTVIDRVELRAVSVDSNTAWLFRTTDTIQYVAQENDYSVIGEVSTDYSRIYEDEAETPYMVTVSVSYSNGWLLPWSWGGGETYHFHVPPESVISQYTIDIAPVTP